MGAIPDYGGAYLDPGVLEAVHEATVYVGEIPGGMTDRAREAGRLLGIGPNKCDVLDDIMGRVWFLVRSNEKALWEHLSGMLDERVGAFGGLSGLCLRDLKSGQEIQIRAD